MNLLVKWLFSLAVVVPCGACFAREIKRAKIGDYEYSYYLETNGTAVIGRFRDAAEVAKLPGCKDADRMKFLSTLSAITPSPTGNLVLPSSFEGHRVSAVGLAAFAGCKELEKVVVPDGIVEIGEGAFVYCQSLVDVELPASLEAIKCVAFFNCSRLKRLVLPQNTKEIGDEALGGCDSLSFIRIPASLRICNDMCKNLKGLRSAYIDDGVKRIPFDCFANCENLEKVRLPKSLISIWPRAFQGCLSLSCLDLPEGLSQICDGAFKDCARLKKIKIPSTVTDVFTSAFLGTPVFSDEGPAGTIVKDGWTLGWRGLKEVDVVINGASKISRGACRLTHARLNITVAEDLPANRWREAISILKDNTNIVKVAIKAPFRDLGGVGDAFWGCPAIEEIELPDTITNIHYACFRDCDRLRKIRMPKDYVACSFSVWDIFSLQTNSEVIKSLAYEDDRSFFAVQLYLQLAYDTDLFDSLFPEFDASALTSQYARRFERFEHVLTRLKQYVADHPDCYTREMRGRRYAFNKMLYGIRLNVRRAQEGECTSWDKKRKKIWDSSPTESRQVYFQRARNNLVQLCEILATAYDLPVACEYLMEYGIGKGEALKRVDYYKRMARHEAMWQRVFPKGSDEYSSSHDAMLGYLQEISDLGYNQQAQMLQLELEAKIAQGPVEAIKHQTSTGTGWFVNKKCVATCWHVVEGAKQIRVEFSGGRQSAAKVVAKDEVNDVAVLEVENPSSDQVSLPIRSRGVKLSDKVFTVGYPLASLLGQSQKYTEGSISAMSGIAGDGRYFQISTPIQPGNSGGALVDENGRVVGLTSAMLNAIKTAQATGTIPQNVNYAIKARYLMAILDDAGIDYGVQDRDGGASKGSPVEWAMKATCLIIAE